jgi:hypothetical protein
MKCPVCPSQKVLDGKLLLSGADDGWVTYFYPKGIRALTLNKSVSLSNGQVFRACADCGHVWSAVEPSELLELIRTSGTPELQAKVKMQQEGK